jgi:hypothetical protein
MTLGQIEQEIAAMPDPLDVPPRQLDQYQTRRAMLQARAQTIRLAESTLADVNPEIAKLTKWHEHLMTWRTTLCDRLMACPPHKQSGLKLSLLRVDRGLDLMSDLLPANLPLDDLMREAGYVPKDPAARARGDAWLGSLPYVEHRLSELVTRRDDTQARLDAALHDG